MESLYVEPRSGAPRPIDDDRIETVIVKILESLPADATRSWGGMAKGSGMAVSSIQSIQPAFGLRPHRVETLKARPEWPFALPQFLTSLELVSAW
jgi:hypothetical protein